MITLKNMINDLAVGVLANTMLCDPATNTIYEKYYPKAVSFINLGLTAIHRRFLLRSGELSVAQKTGIIHYTLRSLYALSNEAAVEPFNYIQDSVANPFKDDILKIEQVFSEDGSEYLINDSTQAYPIFTPRYNVISMIPTDVPQTVFLIYRQNYPRIVLSNSLNALTEEIDIPDFILEALYLKIGTYAYKGITAEDTEANPGRSYMYQYELECKRLEEEGLVANDNNPHNVFEVYGWV